MGDQLLPLPLTERSVHLCVGMQRIFSAEGPWPTPWMDKVLPVAAALAGRHPERTIFTRFIPPEQPDQMPGMWQRYYARWWVATRERLDLRLLELVPPLAALCPGAVGIEFRGKVGLEDRFQHQHRGCPPAAVIDKTRYSAFAEPGLIDHLRQREADALIVSGSETDVCVLATVLNAVDIGYRVIVVRDAICSSSDEGHEMLMRLYRKGAGQESRLCYLGHALMENRNRLVAAAEATLATGTAEREAAAAFSQRLPKGATLGADKGYDAEAFVESLKARGIEPHIAINGTVSKHGKARKTAVPSEVAASVRYAINQRLRKRIEEGFGWTKTVGGLTQVKVRGLAKVRAAFVLAMAAYNIVRLPKLLAPRGEARPAT